MTVPFDSCLTHLAAWRARVGGLRSLHDGAWIKAASAFAIRITNAGLLFVTQILLARWMGMHDFGVYIFAWTLVIMIGDLVPLGLSFATQRLVPEARHLHDQSELRGLLFVSKLLPLAVAIVTSVAAIGLVGSFGTWISRMDPAAIAIAMLALPAYAMCAVLDGIARAFDRVHLALVPPYIMRPLLLVALVAAAHALGLTTNAETAIVAAVVATSVVAFVQFILVERVLARAVAPGPRAFRTRHWLSVSLKILGAWGCLTVFTYSDILVLSLFVSPDRIAIYYAATKALAITSFVSYAVASVLGHRFAAREVAGDRAGLERLVAFSVHLTFWPSLVLTGLLLVAGKPILGLFGPDFTEGYALIFILALGLIARAAIGPAERMLTLLGAEGGAAWVYAVAFLVNVSLGFLLIPRFELQGAALASAASMIVEAALLFFMVRRKLGLHAFVVPWKGSFAPARD